jgi:hypothetical protein
MKLNFSYILVGIVFLVVILLSLGCSCTKVSPYYKENLFSHQFSYEGFGPLSPGEFISQKDSGNLVALSGNLKVEGFEGLQSAPYIAEVPIDIYSDAVGNIKCTPNPYSNSKGYLCLDSTQKELLQTRGGNSTGKDSQIGPQ